MVALFQSSIKEHWGSLSFVSTLYLCPVLDRLMAQVPERWQPEVRLGLQEALVNAVKHGNNLDPHKVISVRYKTAGNQYWWIIEDEGHGFDIDDCCDSCTDKSNDSTRDCGRGLFILHQIFDEVKWARGGRELHLCKRVHRWFGIPRVC
ncbi:anti-sigma regulatory factor [Oscillatoria sp. CS-180]|uniref:ATP-binding protein n=1 Tax=Oscillatoria sp. CS-180 TaxID=3021720 RepID=UPI00232B2A21|nr:anti-sigma regulatory factor [Oscillatoria sp. CS-180]MDB9529875.1 anti-sigma regulatory factor [Oscillatoria sp. CS-180]